MEALVVLGVLILLVFAAANSKGTNSRKGPAQIAAVPMGLFEIRTKRERMGGAGGGTEVVAIEARGLIPVRRPTSVAFVTSVFDQTEGTLLPVLSTIEQFQEPDTPVYQHRVEGGAIAPNQGFGDWVRVGMIVPDLLVPPRRGKRTLVAALRVVDTQNPPPIQHGFGDGEHAGMLQFATATIDFQYEEMGYQEEAAGRDEARCLAVKAALAVAMADGSLAEAEGEVIKSWIARAVACYSGDKIDEMKGRLNSSLRDAYGLAKKRELSLSPLTARLNEVAPRAQRLELLELLFDVMAADGVASEPELEVIRGVGEALSVDYSVLEEMRDRALVRLDSGVGQEASVESLLGIRPEWNRDQVRKHLRGEFKKWSDRLNILAEGTERENAQQMLEKIAKARRRYEPDA
jgi:uncharacterized tellurite resistance protein B-like protein